jgi:hypothetical protein
MKSSYRLGLRAAVSVCVLLLAFAAAARLPFTQVESGDDEGWSPITGHGVAQADYVETSQELDGSQTDSGSSSMDGWDSGLEDEGDGAGPSLTLLDELRYAFRALIPIVVGR